MSGIVTHIIYLPFFLPSFLPSFLPYFLPSPPSHPITSHSSISPCTRRRPSQPASAPSWRTLTVTTTK